MFDAVRDAKVPLPADETTKINGDVAPSRGWSKDRDVGGRLQCNWFNAPELALLDKKRMPATVAAKVEAVRAFTSTKGKGDHALLDACQANEEVVGNAERKKIATAVAAAVGTAGLPVVHFLTLPVRNVCDHVGVEAPLVRTRPPWRPAAGSRSCPRRTPRRCLLG